MGDLATTIDRATDARAIGAFCEKWGVRELSLFGSILRDDFGPDSDVDVLVAFPEGHAPGWQDWIAMEDELKFLFGREVDLVEGARIRNPFRRQAILASKRVIYGRQAG